MYTLVLIIHVITCIALVTIVLLQAGKGAGLGNLFGGGGSDQLFSAPSGSAFLKKLTTFLAALFLLTTLGLTMLWQGRSERSIIDNLPLPAVPQAPAQPLTP